MTTQPNAQQSGAGGAAAPSGFMQAWGTYVGLLVVLAGMIALFSFLSEYFWSKETFVTIANEIPALAVMAVGMTFVLILAGIDLSVGSVLALWVRFPPAAPTSHPRLSRIILKPACFLAMRVFCCLG